MKGVVVRVGSLIVCGGVALGACSSDVPNTVVVDPAEGSTVGVNMELPPQGSPTAGTAAPMDGMAQQAASAPVDSADSPAAPADSGAMAQAPTDAPAMAPGDVVASPPGDVQTPAGSDVAADDPEDSEGDAPAPDSAQGTCLQGSGDFSEDGPYEVRTEDVTIGSSGRFTIFIPEPLEENCLHPVVAWGNGTTVPGGTAYSHFNKRIASWGMFAVASHDDGTANSGPRIGDGSFHKAAIDYMLAQNEDSSSEFFGKVSDKAGVSGHSQGGAGGDRASSHPNVKANGNVQGSFGSAPADVAFLCLTGTDDIATEGCLTAVNGTSAPALYASYDGMGHVQTVTSPRAAGNQQYARLLAAWFRCFLADDTAACEMFQGGEDCPVCQESGWDRIFANNL